MFVNTEYAKKGNIFSLNLARKYLDNAYIIPSDIWCNKNPFSIYELYSWYMVTDLIDDDSEIRVNRKSELVKISKTSGGNTMVGICYLLSSDAEIVRNKMKNLCIDLEHNDSFWEEALYSGNRMIVPAKIAKSLDVVEINTYEQLRELDGNSEHLKSDAIATIAKTLQTKDSCIADISVLKKGMTNRSFLFTCEGKKYIMRIPGEGTDKLINREQEAMVYKAIAEKGMCDDPIYLNPINGYKITKYIKNARTCNPTSLEDLKKCMSLLRKLHELKLKVEQRFDLYKMIDFYEDLWGGHTSVYRDYEKTKENILSLKTFIDRNCGEECLTHIDAVPDNFLFGIDEFGKETLQLTDWEYASMQDPHVDIAMFCIYAMYNREQVDLLIDIYFENNCSRIIRTKIYCYIAVCGLLWSNWCEYKRNLGVEFGEYSLSQYRFAKDYFKLAKERIENEE